MKKQENAEVVLMRKQLIQAHDDFDRRKREILDDWGKEQAAFNSKVYKLRRVLLICQEIRKAGIPSGLKYLEALLDEEVARVLEATKT